VKRGFNEAERQRGWSLLEKVGAHAVGDGNTDLDVRDAIAEIDAWDETNLRLIRAGLTRYPEIREQVLEGVEAASGYDAVLNVDKVLNRLAALEGKPEGEAALKTVAERGVHQAERRRVGG